VGLLPLVLLLLLLLEHVEDVECDPITRDDDWSDDRLVAFESEFSMIPGMVPIYKNYSPMMKCYYARS
jgi:hypothetical protein